MDIQATLAKIAQDLSDPAVPQGRFDQLQSDKAAATERIVNELKCLAAKHNVPLADVAELEGEVVSVVETIMFQPEAEYLDEIECRIDCIQTDGATE